MASPTNTSVPSAPVFRPTRLEFADPLMYIQSIRAEAQLYGICKVIPPDDWKPPVAIDVKNLRFNTRKQRLDLLLHRDQDLLKVEFLTRLVAFWQYERHRRQLPPGAEGANHPATHAHSSGAMANGGHASNGHHGATKGSKRRSESELLADARRRPKDGATSSPNGGGAHSPTTMEDVLEGTREQSATLKDLKAHAQAVARRGAPRATRRAAPAPTVPARSPAKTTATTNNPFSSPPPPPHPLSSHSCPPQFPLADAPPNWTLDGVTLQDGEIVAPKIKQAEVDLFLLWQLVRQRYGGTERILKKQWIELVRVMRITQTLMEDQFRSNQSSAAAAPAAGADGVKVEPAQTGVSPKKKNNNALPGVASSSSSSPSPTWLAEEESNSQIQLAADELRKIYRTYLLPYEQQLEEGQSDSGSSSSSSEDSAEEDEAKEGGGSNQQEGQKKKKHHTSSGSKASGGDVDMKDVSVKKEKRARPATSASGGGVGAPHSHPHRGGVGSTSDLPLPTFSADEIKRWAHVAARKQKEATIMADMQRQQQQQRPNAASASPIPPRSTSAAPPSLDDPSPASRKIKREPPSSSLHDSPIKQRDSLAATSSSSGSPAAKRESPAKRESTISPATKRPRTSSSPAKSVAPSSREDADGGVDPAIVCGVCTLDTLSPAAQCFHCHGLTHLACLTPPLSSPPPLPYYCADCLQAGSFGFEEGERYDLATFEQQANEFRHAWIVRHMRACVDAKCPYHVLHMTSKERANAASSAAAATSSFSSSGTSPPSGPCVCSIPSVDLIRQYWLILEAGDHAHPVTVEYGSDIDTSESGSGFPTTGPFARSGWNLNNLPNHPGSVLRLLTNVSGVTSPWMYVGMMFSSFCHHAEDHYAYSINYLHQGAPKQWYGIPAHAATAFETVARQTLPHLFAKQADLLFQMVTMVSPRVLQARQVPIYALTQEPGEFVLTFPDAYHGGFNHGVNVAEAVNFAPADWLPHAIRCAERYRAFKKTPVFSTDLLLLSLARDRVLDNYTAAWLHRCLAHARAEEICLRQHLRAFGLVKAKRWTREAHAEVFAWGADALGGEDNGGTMTAGGGGVGGGAELIPLKSMRGKSKQKRSGRKVAATNQCVYCKAAVHISAVWCPCRPGVLACLRHAAHLCACGASHQLLLMRYHIDELDRLLARVQHQLDHLADEERSFHEQNNRMEEVIETVGDIADECRQALENTEIPMFLTEGARRDGGGGDGEGVPSYAAAATAAGGASSGRKGGKKNPPNATATSPTNKHAQSLTTALQTNYAFLRTAEAHYHAAQEEANLLPSKDMDASAALAHVQMTIYPVAPVLSPARRQIIPCPPLAQVRNEVDARCLKWLHRVRPFLLTALELKRQARRVEREQRRKDDEEAGSSDDDGDSSDNDDDDADDADAEEDRRTIEPIRFNGGGSSSSFDYNDGGAHQEEDVEAEEERLDGELKKMLKRMDAEERLNAPPPVRGKAAAAKGKEASKGAPIVGQRILRMTLSQLSDFLGEGATLIWSTTRSREVNLVYHKLQQWARMVDQIGRMAAKAENGTTAATTTMHASGSAPAAGGAGSGASMIQSPESTSKEELTTARRIIHSSANAPIEFTTPMAASDGVSATAPPSAAAASASSSAARAVESSNIAHVTAHMARLKAHVTKSEGIQAELDQLFGIDVSRLTVEQRLAHASLPTREELCLLQERVNALPLTFAHAHRLANLHIKMSSWLRRTAWVLGQPLPAMLTADQVARFSPNYRPWQEETAPTASSTMKEATPTPTLSSNQTHYSKGHDDLVVGDLESAVVCLAKLETLPFKHPLFGLLRAHITAVSALNSRARRCLFLAPGYYIARDREMFDGPEEVEKAERQRASGEPSLKWADLQQFHRELVLAPVKPKGLVRRFEKLFAAVEAWQKSVRTFMETNIRTAATGATTTAMATTTAAIPAGSGSAAEEAMASTLTDLRDEYTSFGIMDLPERGFFDELHQFHLFQSHFAAYFLTPCSTRAYSSQYFHFRTFAPADWLAALDRVFDGAHAKKAEGKERPWKEVLKQFLTDDDDVKQEEKDADVTMETSCVTTAAVGAPAGSNSNSKLKVAKGKDAHMADIASSPSPATAAAAGSSATLVKHTPAKRGAILVEMSSGKKAKVAANNKLSATAAPAAAAAAAPKPTGSSAALQEDGDVEMTDAAAATAAGGKSLVAKKLVRKRKATEESERERPAGRKDREEKGAEKEDEEEQGNQGEEKPPTVSEPSSPSKHLHHLFSRLSTSKPTLVDMYRLSQAGHGILAAARANQSPSLQPFLCELAKTIQRQLDQLEAFFRLLMRFQLHLHLLRQLKTCVEALELAGGADTPQSREASATLARLSRVTNATAATPVAAASSPSATLLDCPHYSSVHHQCPFYTIVEIEKLYVLGKALDSMWHIQLADTKTMKEIYKQAYIFQLAARRLRITPHLPTNQLLKPDTAQFDTFLRTHLAVLAQALAPCSVPSTALTKLLDSEGEHEVWKRLRAGTELVDQTDINIEAWHTLLLAERRLEVATTTTTTTATAVVSPAALSFHPVKSESGLWMICTSPPPTPVAASADSSTSVLLVHPHHGLVLHPQNHATYQELVAKYQDLLEWSTRATRVVANLRQCLAWADEQWHRRQAQGATGSGSGLISITLAPSFNGLPVQASVFQPADSIIDEATRRGFYCALWRKLKQARWAAQAYEALVEQRPIQDIAGLLLTHQAWRATHAKSTAAAAATTDATTNNQQAQPASAKEEKEEKATAKAKAEEDKAKVVAKKATTKVEEKKPEEGATDSMEIDLTGVTPEPPAPPPPVPAAASTAAASASHLTSSTLVPLVPPPVVALPPIPLVLNFTQLPAAVTSSSQLIASLAAAPADEFDRPLWAGRLKECFEKGIKWIQEGTRLLITLQQQQQQPPSNSSASSATTPPSEPSLRLSDLQAFCQTMCPCVSQVAPVGHPASAGSLAKQLKARCDVADAWATRIRTWMRQVRRTTSQETSGGGGPGTDQAMGVTAASTPMQTMWPGGPPMPMTSAQQQQLQQPSSSRDERRLHVKHLPRLIHVGQSTLLVTPELTLLQACLALNHAWVRKLDELFQPRHPNLHMRNLLKSLLVPFTSEQEKEKLKALLASKDPGHQAAHQKQRQPIPDCNDLYCICKRPYDDRLFMIACDHCNCWYHGECVNVPMAAAQRLQSYLCCKCSSRTPPSGGGGGAGGGPPPSPSPYAFGSVQFRHARPAIAQCRAAVDWLDEELTRVCDGGAADLIVLQHVRAFRAVLAHVEQFKKYTHPWLQAIDEEHAAAEAATAAAAAGAPTVPPSVSPLFSDGAHLAHLKGCIRQGKKLGINFPELPILKRRYDQARQRKPDTARPAPLSSSPLPVAPSALPPSPHPPPAAAAGPAPTPAPAVREVVEIE